MCDCRVQEVINAESYAPRKRKRERVAVASSLSSKGIRRKSAGGLHLFFFLLRLRKRRRECDPAGKNFCIRILTTTWVLMNPADALQQEYIIFNIIRDELVNENLLFLHLIPLVTRCSMQRTKFHCAYSIDQKVERKTNKKKAKCSGSIYSIVVWYYYGIFCACPPGLVWRYNCN